MITILTSFKPFRGDDAARQRRAVISWKQAFPGCEILAFGESGDLSAIADDSGVVQVGDIPLGDGRVPRADAMFEEAQRRGKFDLQFYTNADMIYGPDMARALEAMPRRKCLLVGQRWDWGAPDTAQTEDHRLQTADLLAGSAGRTTEHTEHTEKDPATLSPCHPVPQSGLQSSVFNLQSDICCLADVVQIQEDAQASGALHGPLAMDYFGYRRWDIQNFPPYYVGAAEWDNGMVMHALQSRLQVVDATASVVAVHQDHDYGYVPGGRAEVFEGPLAQHNHALYVRQSCGHYYGVTDATHVLKVASACALRNSGVTRGAGGLLCFAGRTTTQRHEERLESEVQNLKIGVCPELVWAMGGQHVEQRILRLKNTRTELVHRMPWKMFCEYARWFRYAGTKNRVHKERTC